ncbi:MAG: carboxylating nicotinate-nucleotide diphosphorylase [Luteibaculaceae bacterium]
MTLTQFISLALQEDIKDGDHSTLACIPTNAQGKAKLLVKENGILAGVTIAQEVFKTVDPTLTVEIFLTDGSAIKKGDVVLHVSGKSGSILSAERLVLNIMQRMSGIATYTNHMVKLMNSKHTKLLDTRKTTPLNRFLEKQAVKIGGGENHRFGLYDMIMLKDNHIDYAGGIAQAIQKVKSYLKQNNLNLKIEVEARNLQEVKEILAHGPVDRIMLDNFNYPELKEAVTLINGSAETEASGGITEDTIAQYAACGVDYISVGALTHQIKSLDLSLKAF